MSDFHFLRPWWFAALPVLLVLLWVLWRRRLHSRSWREICDPELLPHLLIGHSTRRANWPLLMLLAGFLLTVTALAGPTWQKQPQPVLRQQSALIIALDLSRSMLAADLKPNRLVRARLKIEDILRQRREGQTALIAFTGDAFAVTPLTDDVRTIQSLLGSLHPDMMPLQGSRPQQVFELAGRLLKQAGGRYGVLMLITDEDRPELSRQAATRLPELGLTLEVIGVGTPEGAPIPLAGGGFFKDRQGNLVLPRLNENGLRELARAGGGDYRRLAIDDSDFSPLLTDLDSRRLDRAARGAERTGDLWQDAGAWLVWPLVLLAACAFRRGWLLSLALFLLLPLPAQALDWSGLWQNTQQQAYEKYQQGDYQAAAQQFRDPRWQAGSHYQAGNYAEALQAAPRPESADDWYNRGNILAQNGQLEEAIKAYDEALKRDPDGADAQVNREIVERALQERQQQQQSSKNGQGNSSDHQPPDRPSRPDKGERPSSEQERQQNSGSQAERPSPGDLDQQRPEASPDKQQARKAEQEQQAEAARAAERQEPRTENPEQQSAAGREEPGIPDDHELQQWLRRIPDDPGGLLRRKFQYQYRQKYQQGGQEDERPW